MCCSHNENKAAAVMECDSRVFGLDVHAYVADVFKPLLHGTLYQLVLRFSAVLTGLTDVAVSC